MVEKNGVSPADAEWHPKPVEFGDIDPKKLVVQEGPNAGATEKNLAHDAASRILEYSDGHAPDVTTTRLIGAEENVLLDRAAELAPDALPEDQQRLGYAASQGVDQEVAYRWDERPKNQVDDMVARIENIDYTKPEKSK
jgi:hypothetical protein